MALGIGAMVKAGLGIAKNVTDLLVGRQKRKEREEYREAGRNEQKVADSEAAVERAKDANKIRDGVAGMSDDELDRRMRERRARTKPE